MKKGWTWLEKIFDGFLEEVGSAIAIAIGTFLGVYFAGQKASKNIVEEINRRDSTVFVASAVKDYDKAREYELAGYEALIKRDFVGALDNFMKSENSYNSYHASYDIALYLKNHSESVDDPDFWEKTYKFVTENFWGLIPKEYLSKMKE